MSAAVFDATPCELGEGPLWHPARGQLYWFDILGRRLLTREDGAARIVDLEERASAAGWIDETALLVATETRLVRLDLETGRREDVAPLEADRPETRSNDGRADPWGGFWISTMGVGGEPGLGAIHRYFRGELRALHVGLTIPNAICFAPDRGCAYFADTPTGVIRRQPLDPAEGWPSGPAEPWLDLSGEGLYPDGAVCDAAGTLWNAQWGAARVARYAPDATFLGAAPIPARNTSCPAFGGPGLRTLYCTSARETLSAETIAAEPENGMTFLVEDAGEGVPEPRVIL